MRVALLGDIHANIEALNVVMQALSKERVDAIYHTGDVVGYCTDFVAVIELLRREGIRGVCGNHELMLLGKIDTASSSQDAQCAIEWTRRRVAANELQHLAELPGRLLASGLVIFHAAPDSWDRNINGVSVAGEAFDQLQRELRDWSIAVHGHTHKQRVFEWRDGRAGLVHYGKGTLGIESNVRYLVCPGSVGVSRDRDPRAAYALYDDAGVIEFKRIHYDWQKCRLKLVAAGLKTPLYNRRHSVLHYVRTYAVKAVARISGMWLSVRHRSGGGRAK